MHGRPRPKKGGHVDLEKEALQKQKNPARVGSVIGAIHVWHGHHRAISVVGAATQQTALRIACRQAWTSAGLQSANFQPFWTSHASLKALLYGKLAQEVLSRRAGKRYDPESLALAAKLLALNPEVYTIWNYRREALEPVLEGSDAAAAAAAVAGELRLTEAALRVNPKSYAAWHHRTWVVRVGKSDLHAELQLAQTLLRSDDRNFHGWAYWRALQTQLSANPADGLDYTTAKIEENFSNYSAWHARAALLPAAAAQSPTLTLAQLMAADTPGASAAPSVAVPAHVLDEEFELVKNAFFTLPEDQSAWFYHRWLLSNALATARAARDSPEEASAKEALLRRLQEEAAMCRELLEIEPGSKWPLLTLARLCEALAQHGEGPPTESSRAAASSTAVDTAPHSALGASPVADKQSGQSGIAARVEMREHESATAEQDDHRAGAGDRGPAAEARSMYRQLVEVDPLRRGYYEDAVAGKAQVVLRALGTA